MKIEMLASYAYDFMNIINLISYTIVFIGCLYLVIHNTRLPRWHLTTLWYVSLSAIFTAITIVLEFLLGEEFPLSYTNIGIIGETSLSVTLAVTSLLMMLSTARRIKWQKAK
jgi:hypothetical protein